MNEELNMIKASKQKKSSPMNQCLQSLIHGGMFKNAQERLGVLAASGSFAILKLYSFWLCQYRFYLLNFLSGSF